MDEQSWKSLIEELKPAEEISVHRVEIIIDDALCMGFEFIVKNHDIYFKEREE